MKKSLLFALILGTLALGVPAVEAKTKATSAPAAVDPQIRVQIGRNRNPYRYRRANRSYLTTRIVRIGRNRYRETVRVTYLWNGRTRTQLISRTRIGRAW